MWTDLYDERVYPGELSENGFALSVVVGVDEKSRPNNRRVLY